MSDRADTDRPPEPEWRMLMVDLLKHVSTLDVAALVLFLALLKDFPSGGFVPGLPTVTLGLFGFSLVTAMLGLIYVGTTLASSSNTWRVGAAYIVSFLAFVVGMLFAVIVGFRAV